jgi:predicted acyl esterase
VPSTDFIVSLQDVFPNGNIINIQEGGSKVNVEDGINKVNISVWATGYQINQGHKLRAVISSSWFPRFNRNLNSGEPIFSAQRIHVADQILYSGKYPSSITLPLLNVTSDGFSEN